MKIIHGNKKLISLNKKQKTKKHRKIPITESIKKAVNLYINQIKYFEFDEYVFKSHKDENKPIGISSARAIFNKMAKDLNTAVSKKS